MAEAAALGWPLSTSRAWSGRRFEALRALQAETTNAAMAATTLKEGRSVIDFKSPSSIRALADT